MTDQTDQPSTAVDKPVLDATAVEERGIDATASIDGATSLSEAASLAHGYAAELRRLHDEGYLLRGPIKDGKGAAYKPGGDNPNLVGDHEHLHAHEQPHEPAEEPNRGFVTF